MQPTTSPTSTAVTDRDRVIIFDTTLRDGEQSPGAMNIEEKVQVAATLEKLGVDVIEAVSLLPRKVILRRLRPSLNNRSMPSLLV